MLLRRFSVSLVLLAVIVEIDGRLEDSMYLRSRWLSTDSALIADLEDLGNGTQIGQKFQVNFTDKPLSNDGIPHHC